MILAQPNIYLRIAPSIGDLTTVLSRSALESGSKLMMMISLIGG